jgi:hypothetical protein
MERQVHIADFVIYVDPDGNERDGFVVGNGSDANHWTIFNKDDYVEDVSDDRIVGIKNKE